MPPHGIKSCVLGLLCCSVGSFSHVQSGCEVLSFSTKYSGHTSERGDKLVSFEKRENKYCWSSAAESNIPPLWKIYSTGIMLVSLLISDVPSDDFSLPAVVMVPFYKTQAHIEQSSLQLYTLVFHLSCLYFFFLLSPCLF